MVPLSLISQVPIPRAVTLRPARVRAVPGLVAVHQLSDPPGGVARSLEAGGEVVLVVALLDVSVVAARRGLRAYDEVVVGV